jgi:hypothetical protein
VNSNIPFAGRFMNDSIHESLSTPEMQVAVFTAVAGLAERWLATISDVDELMADGKRVVLEVTLRPTQALCLVLVDGNGRRVPLVSRAYERTTVH